MDKDQFHKAARDGFLDLLRETTRRDCNEPDEDGFSPTIWSCYYGRLDALRLLIGRGGDPDKSDLLGNTSLHWSAANGHFDCVTFLVNFGCNIWALNNDFQTAKDFAALRNHKMILDFLDSTMAKQSALNPKLVQKSKERAVVEAEKRIKQFEKIQRKATKKAEKEESKNAARRRKLLEPIQITNNRLQPVEYSTISNTGTLRWTVAGKKSKDVPLKFSDLVNNTNSIQRTNQFNSLLANVKGTLNGSTSLSLVRSLGAVSKRVQLKKHSSTSSSSSSNDEQHAANDERLTHNQDQCTTTTSNGQLKTDNLSAIKSRSITVRSTGLCRDTDVLYVRKQPNYGLNPTNQTQLHLKNDNKLNESQRTVDLTASGTANIAVVNSLNKAKNVAKKGEIKCVEEERSTKTIELKNEVSLPNNSVKSLDNNNNTKQNESANKAKLKLKELFVQMKAIDTTNTTADSLYQRNGKVTKPNSISRVSTLFKRGLARATSESDMFELKKGENRSFYQTNDDEYRSNKLNRNNRSQLIQSTAKLNNLNDSPTGSLFKRPGLGSMTFRNNLYAQVLQLSKQLNELDGDVEHRTTCSSPFKPLLGSNLTHYSPGGNRFDGTQKPIQTTSCLQLMQRMNKQLRNELENDSIGNSLSSRSTNSSTNSTLSSNLIENELNDNLDMKLSSKSQSKTRKSLKSIQSANHDMNKQSNRVDQSSEQIEKLDLKLDKQQSTERTVADQSTSQSDKQSNEGTEHKSKDNQQVDEKMPEPQCNESMQQVNDNQLSQVSDVMSVEKLDQASNDKVELKEQRKEASNLTKKYHETYEKLNGQSLNRKEMTTTTTTNRTTNDKLYEKKNDKLLKIKDKFLNRLNSRLDCAKDRHPIIFPVYETTKFENCSERKTNETNNSSSNHHPSSDYSSTDSSSKCSSNCSSKTNSLSKRIAANQLDESESWQDAGTEIAIEKISTICTSNNCTDSHTEHEQSNSPVENQIKKFENINKMNSLSNGENNDLKTAHLNSSGVGLLKEDSHVFKLMVKNRDSIETPIHYL